MEEYARGARDALAWALMLLSNVKTLDEMRKVSDQIHEAIQMIQLAGIWKKPPGRKKK